MISQIDIDCEEITTIIPRVSYLYIKDQFIELFTFFQKKSGLMKVFRFDEVMTQLFAGSTLCCQLMADPYMHGDALS